MDKYDKLCSMPTVLWCLKVGDANWAKGHSAFIVVPAANWLKLGTAAHILKTWRLQMCWEL